MDKLKEVVSRFRYINNFPITMDNVAMVANTALSCPTSLMRFQRTS